MSETIRTLKPGTTSVAPPLTEAQEERVREIVQQEIQDKADHDVVREIVLEVLRERVEPHIKADRIDHHDLKKRVIQLELERARSPHVAYDPEQLSMDFKA